VIPESVDSSQAFYIAGAVILILGVLAGLAGVLIKRRLEEEHRDERYVRERRGEDVVQAAPPRFVGLLQYAGVGLTAVGIIVIVAGWTLAPGTT
jgi:hypothetical protein